MRHFYLVEEEGLDDAFVLELLREPGSVVWLALSRVEGVWP